MPHAVPNSRRWLLATMMPWIALVLPGCAQEQTPHPVSGTILFEGERPAKELAGGLVVFTCRELKVSAVGDIDANGAYQLTTRKKYDCAIPGNYVVTIVAPEPEIKERGRVKPTPIIDPRYENPKTSGLSAAVEAKNNEFNFTIRKNKATRR